MKFKVKVKDVLDCMSNVISIVPNKPEFPILGAVKLDAYSGCLTISINNIELGVIADIQDADIEIDGTAIVNANNFYKILRESDKSILNFEYKDNKAFIDFGASKFELVCLDEDEFAQIETGVVNTTRFEMRAYLFKKMIDKVCFACAKEKTRHSINGVLFELENNKLTLVATDGRRLAKSSIRINAEVESLDRLRYIASPKLLTQSLKCVDLKDESSNINIILDSDRIVINYKNYLFSSRLLEGSFPEYAQFIPKDEQLNLATTIDRKNLVKAIKQASIFNNEDVRSVKFEITQGLLEISSKNTELGRANIELEIKANTDKFEIAFNPIFVIEALNVIENESVGFEFISSDNPAIIRDSMSEYIFMPMDLEKAS